MDSGKTKSEKYLLSVALGIIVVACALAYASVWNDSIIVDEDPHIGAGYSYLAKRDMRLNAEHPPLAKDLSALPLLLLKLHQDAFQTPAWTSDVNGQWEFGRKLIFQSGNDADLIARAAKLPMFLFFIGAAWLVFVWTRRLHGDKAALLALTLFAFSPTVMAHARFVTTDVPAMFGVLSATFFFLNYLKNPSRKSLCLATLFFGIALLLKFSTILLIPFFILIWIIHSSLFIRHYSLKSLLIPLAGFLLVVLPVYYVQIINYPPDRQRVDTEELLASNTNPLKPAVVWASDKPVIRAAAQYGLGLLMVVQRSAGGNTLYYRGEVLKTAGPSYFPFVYAIKEPLPWLALLAIAITIAVARFQVSSFKFQDHFDAIAMLMWIALYLFVSIRSNLNIGIRHLLPIYPFAIILVLGSISKLKHFKLPFSILIFALCIWYVAENVRVFPHYLTYFNQLAGGPTQGYRYVVDSNLDWGQDLKRLATWVEKNDIQKIHLDYFGWADPAYYLGERYISLHAENSHTITGYLAISATFFQNEREKDYAWLATRTPTAVIGNSIFVYNISDPQF